MIVDEVLAVGDVGFRNKCLGKMGDAAREGRSILFVSHSMPAVETLCRRAILLDEGRVAGSGATADVIGRYYELNRGTQSRSEGPIGASADGAVEISEIATLDTDGEPLLVLQPGRDFVLRLTLRARRPLRRAVAQVVLHDALGTRVVAFSSRTSGRELEIPEGESHVHCVVHDPPLAPGSYDADVRLNVGMESLVFGRNVASFSFAENDYYKSGGLPGECASARCLVRQSWSVEPR
jgi:lipopolysaccharide transport system ATP-binding protein